MELFTICNFQNIQEAPEIVAASTVIYVAFALFLVSS